MDWEMVRIGQAEAAFGEQSPKGEASDGSKADFKLLGLNNEKMPSTKRSEWGRAVWGASEALSLEQALSEMPLCCSNRGTEGAAGDMTSGIRGWGPMPTWASSEVTQAGRTVRLPGLIP